MYKLFNIKNVGNEQNLARYENIGSWLRPAMFLTDTLNSKPQLDDYNNNQTER